MKWKDITINKEEFLSLKTSNTAEDLQQHKLLRTAGILTTMKNNVELSSKVEKQFHFWAIV